MNYLPIMFIIFAIICGVVYKNTHMNLYAGLCAVFILLTIFMFSFKSNNESCNQSVERYANFSENPAQIAKALERSLLVPENNYGTIGTQKGINEWMSQGINDGQLRKSILSLKLVGAGPTPNVTVSGDIIEPNGISAIEISPKEYKESFDINRPNNVILFYKPTCGYCHEFMKKNGLWDSVKLYMNQHNIHYNEINIEQNPTIVNQYNVIGVPYIVKIHDNIPIPFNEAREYDNLIRFIQN